VSQSKISRIETGAVTPTPEDVRQIVLALGQSDEVAAEFQRRAEAQYGRPNDGQHAPAGRFQTAYEDYEHAATDIRSFEGETIPGLLQTSAYAREVLRKYADLFGPENMIKVSDGVALRLRRQKLIWDDHGKSFRFVILESVLRSAVGSPTVMLGQIENLLQVLDEASGRVQIFIVPSDRPRPYPVGSGFTIYDNKRVLVEVTHTVVRTDTEVDVAAYRKILDSLEAIALADTVAGLKKYQEHYLRQLPSPSVGKQG